MKAPPAIKTQDCTACAHRIPHPNPTQPFHHWLCAAHQLCVGDRVMNCGSFRAKPAAKIGAAA